MRDPLPRSLPLLSLLPVAALAVLAVLSAACAGDPQARVEEARSRYVARVNGFVVRDLPAEAALPERQVVDLDVLVRRDGRESVPGLTLDVSVAAPGGKEKAHRLTWVDTSQLQKGGEIGITVRLEEVAYAPGDGFYVEVRHPVPAAERGAYREFGGGS